MQEVWLLDYERKLRKLTFWRRRIFQRTTRHQKAVSCLCYFCLPLSIPLPCEYSRCNQCESRQQIIVHLPLHPSKSWSFLVDFWHVYPWLHMSPVPPIPMLWSTKDSDQSKTAKKSSSRLSEQFEVMNLGWTFRKARELQHYGQSFGCLWHLKL